MMRLYWICVFQAQGSAVSLLDLQQCILLWYVNEHRKLQYCTSDVFVVHDA